MGGGVVAGVVGFRSTVNEEKRKLIVHVSVLTLINGGLYIAVMQYSKHNDVVERDIQRV